ncbi:MAG: hypothetical protein IJ268_12275 [Proteobacteria bacterium]|nr:hypothetical protein [Pseudomonadota bacterium]MBQ9241910.1 hypothetical protein [Pseudomonadota bacterium]
MGDDDLQLSQALSQLSDASDIIADEEVEEVARVRKARAGVTEYARQSGDCVGSLLSGLLNESNAEIEAEKEEKERRAREAQERERREKEEAEEKKRREIKEKMDEEQRLIVQKEQRRLKMIAELEKKRKKETGELAAEEAAKKRAEEEEKARKKAEEKAREEAEAAKLNNANAELAQSIETLKVSREAAAAEAKRKSNLTKGIVAGFLLIFVVGIGVLSYMYLSNLKAPDYYVLCASNPDQDNAKVKCPVAYEMLTPEMDTNLPAADFTEEMARLEVVQEAPQQQSSGRKHGPSKPTDVYGIGSAANVFGTGTIVK